MNSIQAVTESLEHNYSELAQLINTHLYTFPLKQIHHHATARHYLKNNIFRTYSLHVINLMTLKSFGYARLISYHFSMFCLCQTLKTNIFQKLC